MKEIERIKLSDYPGIKELSPMEMNKIHFETGRHTQVAADSVSAVGRPGAKDA